MEPFRFRRPLALVSGFTLVEMMVVLTIIGIVAAIVIAGQSTFNRSLILANTAYDVALSLRDAQTYGIASRGTGSIFNPGYGIEFNGGTPTSFLLFTDTAGNSCANKKPDCKPGDGIYTSSGPSQDLLAQTYKVNNGMKISNFCASASSGPSYCYSGGTPVSRLDIVFARPNTSASITVLDSGNNPTSGLTQACIVVSAPTGETRIVRVNAIGEVEFKPVGSTCP